MDHMNENPSSLKDQMDAENKKFIESLLNGEEFVEEPIDEPQPQEAQTEIKETFSEVQDSELEKILSEDWLQTSEAAMPEELDEGTDILEDLHELAAAIPEESISPEPAQEEQSQPSEPEAKEVPVQKIRPKRKPGYGLFGIPHILSTVVWLALIVATGISLGRVLWVCCADVMAFGKAPQTVTITITEDDTIDTIAQKLGHANLVRYPELFKFFATVTGKDDDIGVGTFTLNAQLDYNAMINAMYDFGPQREVVEIMFPEGVNCAQIFKLLEDKNVCSAAELEEYAANGELTEYWFLEGIKRGDKYCLEGYLAPDTYKFYTGDSPRRVLEKFLDEFEDRFTDIMKKDFETMQKTYADRLRTKGFSSSYIQENTLTLHQVITLASVIQKESASDAECFDIASAFYNRLVNPDIMSLGADATVYYALGDFFGEIDALTADHLNVDSPYNTRKYKGIPPGPICNMGVQALYAALEPNQTNYHYFVFDPEKNAHRFAATYSEHLKNLSELGY